MLHFHSVRRNAQVWWHRRRHRTYQNPLERRLYVQNHFRHSVFPGDVHLVELDISDRDRHICRNAGQSDAEVSRLELKVLHMRTRDARVRAERQRLN